MSDKNSNELLERLKKNNYEITEKLNQLVEELHLEKRNSNNL